MASTGIKKGMSEKNKRAIGWVVGFLVVMFGLVMIFGTPSAETVFKDMNEKMLETKSVTIDQKLTMKGVAEINSRMFMDFSSSKELLAKGNFSLSITDASSPMTIASDLIKIGDSSYIRYNKMSSTNSAINTSLSASESKLKNKWVKVRSNDQYASFSSTPIELMATILPIPYANLNDTQRKSILALLQNKSMYTVSESSKVDTAGVSAYKYLLTYNVDQYNKVAKALADYVSYFKSDSSSNDEITSLTVWVDISTKQIIKIEYTGTTKQGDVTGVISFSGYNQSQTVEKPSDYSIESELLN